MTRRKEGRRAAGKKGREEKKGGRVETLELKKQTLHCVLISEGKNSLKICPT